jgi:hypothetical protein
MGVPTSEDGYTSATTGRGDHEVHKAHVVALGEKNEVKVCWHVIIIFVSTRSSICVIQLKPKILTNIKGRKIVFVEPSFTYWPLCLFHRPTALVALSLLFEVLQSHTDSPNSLGILWTSDQPVTKTTHNTNILHPRLLRNSNPQSQQASGRRPTP